MERIDFAVLGGSGFYDMPGLTDVREVAIETPYGQPSDLIRIGTLAGRRVAFMARHGRGHRLLPAEIPQRANFWALRSLGVERVLGVSAVGSLQDDCHPGDLVVVDQFIDRTRGGRPATYFGEGVVAHIGFADPVCESLREVAVRAARESGAGVHNGGTYVCIEGPAFGTRAESVLYRRWGAQVVGMTAIPEAKLAREAELCYAVVATVTDYDSWHDVHAAVDATTVFAVLQQNVQTSVAMIQQFAAMLPVDRACGCGSTLDSALVTEPAAIPDEARARLGPILARRLGQ